MRALAYLHEPTDAKGCSALIQQLPLPPHSPSGNKSSGTPSESKQVAWISGSYMGRKALVLHRNWKQK